MSEKRQNFQVAGEFGGTLLLAPFLHPFLHVDLGWGFGCKPVCAPSWPPFMCAHFGSRFECARVGAPFFDTLSVGINFGRWDVGINGMSLDGGVGILRAPFFGTLSNKRHSSAGETCCDVITDAFDRPRIRATLTMGLPLEPIEIVAVRYFHIFPASRSRSTFRPSIDGGNPTFNMVLRAERDCGVG